MRMFTIPNQSSVPKAWTEFDPVGRMKPSSLRDRVVDVMEEVSSSDSDNSSSCDGSSSSGGGGDDGSNRQDAFDPFDQRSLMLMVKL